jgi:DNA-directed RNA polymerase subunit RPC12/RpoP
MENLFFKCGCGGPLITDEAAAGSSVDCPHCHGSTIVPTTFIVEECPGCKQPLKAAANMDGELVNCPYCEAEVRCPYLQDDEIFFACRRCHESVSIPRPSAGKLVTCPKCQHWIRAPLLLEGAGDAAAETVRQARNAKAWPAKVKPIPAA